jgi:hypothetical protein
MRLRQAVVHRNMVAVVALLLPVPGHALTAEAGLLGSAIAAASDMTSPGNALTLALVGVWLSLFETASRNAGLARAGFGLAGVIAGCTVGVVFDAPRHLDALIAGSGCAIALIMLANFRMARVAPIALTIVAALFGLRVGTTLRLGGNAIQLATYCAVVVAVAAALIAAGVALGSRLRLRGGTRVVRGLGGWMAALAALLVVNASLRSSVGLDATPADLSVRNTALSDDEIPVLVQSLIKQIYLAFEKTDEDAIYEALAMVVHDDVLADLYLQKRAALVLKSNGDSRSELRVVDLERVTAGRLQGQVGYRVHGAWRVTESVGHWGHVHDRVNRYEADLSILPVDGSWKIAKFDLLDVVSDDPTAAQ